MVTVSIPLEVVNFKARCMVFKLVLPTRVFKITEEVDFESLVQDLKGFRQEKPHEKEDGGTVSLVSEVLDLEVKEDLVYEVFSQDFVSKVRYRRQMTESLITQEAPFWIKDHEGNPVLLVQAPSTGSELIAPSVASKLAENLFSGRGSVVEGRISHDTLKDLHEANPEATKLIWFDQVDLPGIGKQCLAGSDVADTDLYRRYLKNGKIWYVVFVHNLPLKRK
ncbi:MAG: hypothetical protein ACOC6G_03875 [Thermoproteota archaeon]